MKLPLKLPSLLLFWILLAPSVLNAEETADVKEGHPSIHDALVKFLSAKNLTERSPYMTKSRRSNTRLEKTVLAKPLPAFTNIAFTNRIDNEELNRREYFFSVQFKREEGVDSHPASIYLQVSEWGDLDNPRVHTDAFLDLFSQKLEKFAEKVSKEALVLHAVVGSYRYNFDPKIPNYKTTGFLKVRRHPDAIPFFRAHFSLDGALYREITHPTGLPWATPALATITVAWNTDDPEKPHIRLLKINGFTWDP